MKTIISFSGGKTSAYMTRMLTSLENIDPIIVFANTGQEHEETLNFVKRCADEWNIDVVWIEAIVNDGRIGSTHKIVDYGSASRNGEPFEEVIKKYGISNKAWPHCTRELKLNPIYSYLKSIELDDYQVAIGLRIDEQHRAIKEDKRGNIFYPLINTWPTTKRMINEWWKEQPFNLNIEEYQGNCTWCWKKSLKKHFALIETQPWVFKFPRMMERKYPTAGHNTDGNHRVFFRGNLSTDDLFDLYKEGKESQYSFNFEFDDEDPDCGESCDIHAEMKQERCSGF